MKRLLLATVAVIGLSGCASDKISPAESVLLGCDAFASSLNILGPLRADGKLNDATVAVVERTRAGVDPICLGDAPDVDATVKDVAVDAGVKVLQAVIAQVL